MTPLLLAVLALLMMINAPVARAAAITGPLGAICHDATADGNKRQAPSPDHCAVCITCCAVPAVALPDEGAAVVPPLLSDAVVFQPERFARSIRGPPARRPHARGPPQALA